MIKIKNILKDLTYGKNDRYLGKFIPKNNHWGYQIYCIDLVTKEQYSIPLINPDYELKNLKVLTKEEYESELLKLL